MLTTFVLALGAASGPVDQAILFTCSYRVEHGTVHLQQSETKNLGFNPDILIQLLQHKSAQVRFAAIDQCRFYPMDEKIRTQLLRMRNDAKFGFFAMPVGERASETVKYIDWYRTIDWEAEAIKFKEALRNLAQPRQ